MSISKITSKFQATIPKEVREMLGVKAGDCIVFEVMTNGQIVVRKEMPFDKMYAKSVEKTLSEWGSVIDDEDFEDLQ